MLSLSHGLRPDPVTLPLAVVFSLALSLGSASSTERDNNDPAKPLLMVENLPSTTGELHDVAQAGPLQSLDRRALHITAAVGDVDGVKRLVNKYPERINSKDSRGLTPLHEGAREGHADVVQVLVEAGANPNDTTIQLNQTPLHLAAKIGSEEVYKILLKAGADPTFRDKDNMTALVVAIQEGHTELVRNLADAGLLSLHDAVSSGHMESVKIVLDEIQRRTAGTKSSGYYGEGHGDYYGISVNFSHGNVDQNTPLHIAAANGHAKIVKLLLQAGAYVLVQNKSGKTPIDLADEQGHQSLAQMLGRIPALLEAAGSGHIEQVETLLTAGTFPDARDPDGPMPLHRAAEAGHADVVRLLVGAGANVDIIYANSSCGCCSFYLQYLADIMMAGVNRNSSSYTSCGNTALLLATRSKSSNPEPVKILIQAGADPNIPNESGRTPLHWAVSWADEREQVELVNLLIQAGANVNAADQFGATPLRFAAEIGSVDGVKALISAGANPNSEIGELELGNL